MEDTYTARNYGRIQEVGQHFSLLWGTLMWLLPAGIILQWWFALNEDFISRGPTSDTLQLLLQLLTFSPLILGFFHLRVLFKLYGEGIIFATESVKAIRGFGVALIWLGVFCLANPPVSSLTLAMFSERGDRYLTLGIGTDSIIPASVGFVIVVIAWVMEEARKIDEEQTWTV